MEHNGTRNPSKQRDTLITLGNRHCSNCSKSEATSQPASRLILLIKPKTMTPIKPQINFHRSVVPSFANDKVISVGQHGVREQMAFHSFLRLHGSLYQYLSRHTRACVYAYEPILFFFFHAHFLPLTLALNKGREDFFLPPPPQWPISINFAPRRTWRTSRFACRCAAFRR